MPEIASGVQTCKLPGSPNKQKHDTDGAEKCYTNMDSILKLRDNNTKPMVETKSNKTTEYFLSGLT